MMSRSRRALVSRVLRITFALLGVAFLVIAFTRTWDGTVAEVSLPWWRVAVAGPVTMAGLACAFQAWATLVGGDQRRALAWGFYISQLGKYIPGGIWQAVGQVGYTARANVPIGRATTAFATFTVTQAVAGGVVGGTVAIFGPELRPLLRVAALTALGLSLFLHRRWMVLALSLARRFRQSLDVEALVPSQAAILRSAAWAAGTMLAYGAAFAVLFDGLGGAATPLLAITAAVLAWTIGFLVLPVPSGIGVREVVLIALLGGTASTPTLIVASVYHRLILMAGEALMIVGARWGLHRAGRARQLAGSVELGEAD